MKKLLLPILTCAALTASSYAGEDYSAKGGKVVVPPPPSCLWTWFAGGSVGTIQDDWDEEIYTLHVGVERKCPDESCTHAFYLEVGFTEKDESYLYDVLDEPVTLKLDCEVIPITINYKYECQLSDKLNWYIGGGAGVALIDCKASASQGGRQPVSVSESEDDTVFYGHVFCGIVYNVSESVELYGGVRYIFLDEPDFMDDASPIVGDDFELDGGIHYELGVRVNF